MTVRQLVRGLVRPGVRGPFVRRGGFSPLSAWSGPGGNAGMFLHPRDLSTGYQDSLGTTPQTATAQPTGLRLDKRLGLARGAEKLTDPGFDTPAAWTPQNGDWVVAGGKATYTEGGLSYVQPATPVALVANTTYEAIFTLADVSAGASAVVFSLFNHDATVNLWGAYQSYAASGTYRIIFTPAANTSNVRIYGNNSGIDTSWSLTDFSLKELPGNHVRQATGGSRPEFTIAGGISSDFMGGTDDGYGTAAFSAGTLINGMDLFVALNRVDTNMVVCSMNSGASYTLGISDDGGAAATSGAGTVTHWVNGVQVPGGTATTAAQLKAAAPAGQWAILEVQGMNLSTWTAFRVSLYTSFMVNGDFGGLILCPTQSDAMRTQLRRWLGREVGLSL